MSRLRVTVVMPVLDGERWIAEALASLAAQERRADEVIVVDNGCRDRSMEIVARDAPGAIVVEGPRAGIALSYETGIRAATGDAVGFLDADDRYAPGAIATLAAVLEGDPDAEIACGAVRMFADATTRFSGLRPELLDRPHVTRLPGTVLVRRALLASLLPLHRTAQRAWDVDMFTRAQERGARLVTVPEVVNHKRMHAASTIHESPVQVADMLRVLHESIARRQGRDAG